MSDFRLPEIARKIGKDVRTIQRWCDQGYVPGAYKTSGGKKKSGHWRINGDSVEVVVDLIWTKVTQRREKAGKRIKGCNDPKGKIKLFESLKKPSPQDPELHPSLAVLNPFGRGTDYDRVRALMKARYPDASMWQQMEEDRLALSAPPKVMESTPETIARFFYPMQIMTPDETTRFLKSPHISGLLATAELLVNEKRYSMEALGKELGISRSTLYRKLKGTTSKGILSALNVQHDAPLKQKYQLRIQ